MVYKRLLGLLLLGFSAGMFLGAEEANLNENGDGWSRVISAPEILAKVAHPPCRQAARLAQLTQLLRQAGKGEVRRQPLPGRLGEENVLALLPGRRPAILVIGAHWDSVSTGAIDNWSGVVMLAALHRFFSRQTPQLALLFVGFAGEEKGQTGSRHFLSRLSSRQKANIKAMINLDCLGAGQPGLWWENREFWETACVRASALSGVPAGPEIIPGFTSDARVFARSGVPAITIHSLDQEKTRYINNENDTPQRIKLQAYRDSFYLLVSLIRIMADGRPETAGVQARAGTTLPELEPGLSNNGEADRETASTGGFQARPLISLAGARWKAEQANRLTDGPEAGF